MGGRTGLEFPQREGNSLSLLRNGREIFPAMLEAIRAAQHSVCLETYIYWSGEIAWEFAEALSERARSGVAVRVVLDWYGCQKIKDELLTTMREAGVQVRLHRPLRWYQISRANHRSHRKLMVTDGTVGFIGGVGIADVWLGDAQDPDHWRDNHYRVQGPVVQDLQELFFTHWNEDDIPPRRDPHYYPALSHEGRIPAQLVASEPVNGSNRIEECYFKLLEEAQSRFLLVAPYFAPRERLLGALCDTARRGVTVEVVTAGEYHDMRVVRRAGRHDWGRLFEAGVRLFEYQPTLIHVKLIVIDERRTFIGSANFDARSTRLNDEASLLVEDAEVARQHAEVFAADRAQAREVTREQWLSRPLWKKGADALANLIRPQL